MRRLLISMGVIFTGLLGLVFGVLAYVGVLASQSADHNKSAAIALVEEVSATWSIDYNQTAFAPSALAQASTPAGRRALAVMSRLGQLKGATHVSQTGYEIDFETGTTVTIAFHGEFQHGSGAVTVVMRFIDEQPRIVELDLKKILLVRKRQRRVAV